MTINLLPLLAIRLLLVAASVANRLASALIRAVDALWVNVNRRDERSAEPAFTDTQLQLTIAKWRQEAES